MPNSLNKSTLQLKTQFNLLKQYRTELNRQLNNIQLSKAYKIWQFLNHIKPLKTLRRNSSQLSHSVNNDPSVTQPKEKIAFLTDRLLTGFGVDLVVDQQATLLSNEFDVTVFAVTIDATFVINKPYRVTQLEIPFIFNPIKQDWISFKFYLNNFVKFTKFKTVVVHTPTYNSWLPFLRKNCKTVVYYYGNSPSSDYSGLKKFRKPIMDILENLIYLNFADELASISVFLTKSLWQKHSKRTKVIHLGSDHVTNQLQSIQTTQRQKIRKRFDISPSDVLITYIGRLDYHNNPYKNTQFLKQIAREFDSPKKCKVIAIGYPENNIQEEFYEAGIYSVANATTDELVSILEQSRVHISPSLWEGFNLPLLEAQAVGVPVVAFRIGAHTEVVDDLKSGFLVTSEDQFIEKIKLILSDDVVRSTLSKNASVFSSNLTWEVNVSKFSKLL